MEVKRLFDLLEYRKSTNPETAVFVAKYNGEWKKIFIIKISSCIKQRLLAVGFLYHIQKPE